jgi:aldehyde dehydrogenase (NAD+)
MRAAAEHLTPVTLELGGKSPCYVDQDVDLEVAARRIVWGKFFNAGQTCVAPDYVLAHRNVIGELTGALATTIRGFYGDDPKTSPDYGRIINDRHFQRLSALLGSGKTVCGGDKDGATRYIAPTVITDVDASSPLMQEEIFGPILPVLPIDSAEAAIAFINRRDKPLALYVFSNSREVSRALLTRTSSGGACVNDTVAHLGVPELPFGGVGPSGMGSYHGKSSFNTFSHKKSVLTKSTHLDVALRYPPYEADKVKWARRLA